MSEYIATEFDLASTEFLSEYEEIIRCRGCKCVSIDEFGIGWCIENCREVKPWDFCAWGERETVNKTGDIVTHDSVKVVGE